MFVLFLPYSILSNSAQNARFYHTLGHCISCAELHFWCKYRHISEISQEFSIIFSKKREKLAFFRAFQRFFYEKYAKNSLFMYVYTHSAGYAVYTLLYILELCGLRGPGEGYDVTDILHAGDEKDEPLKAESEAGVGA